MSPQNDTPGARRRRERERAQKDETLFAHLGLVHKLEEDDLDLLTAIAEKLEFTRKSDIFVRPSVIETSPDLTRWSLAKVKRIRVALTGHELHPTGDRARPHRPPGGAFGGETR